MARIKKYISYRFRFEAATSDRPLKYCLSVLFRILLGLILIITFTTKNWKNCLLSSAPAQFFERKTSLVIALARSFICLQQLASAADVAEDWIADVIAFWSILLLKQIFAENFYLVALLFYGYCTSLEIPFKVFAHHMGFLFLLTY